MGIPTLQHLLAPHAQALVLQQSHIDASTSTSSSQTEQRHRIHAVIDGPGLAYHALHIAQLQLKTRLAQYWWRCAEKRKQQDPTTSASPITRQLQSQGGARGALAALPKSSNFIHHHALAATPSYRAVAAAMVAWLDALDCHGVHVDALLFDGALPDAKRNVRLERMKRLLDKVHNSRGVLRENYDEMTSFDQDNGYAKDIANLRHSSQETDGTIQKSSENKSGRQSFHNSLSTSSTSHAVAASPMLHSSATDHFPPPIFLVAAMLECLRAHPVYASITRMVPGEADPFCAAHADALAARHPDSSMLIMTSDSDLFAYDLHDNVNVVLFKDVTIREGEQSTQTELHAQVYCSSLIAKQFGLTSLLPLAFSVQSDRHRSLTTHLIEARRLEKSGTAAYEHFSHQYTLPEFDIKSLDFDSALQSVDTKTSELVQAWLFATDDADKTSGALPAMYMYLPTGIEDAQRASMWSYGADIRQVAYSVLLNYRPAVSIESVIECLRKGNRIGETAVPTLHAAKTTASIQAFQTELVTLKAAFHTRKFTSWRSICLLLLCQSLLADGKTLPPKSMLSQIYTGCIMPQHCTWQTVQLQAQYIAILDSWRILRQCLDIHLEMTSKNNQMYRVNDVELLLRTMKEVGSLSVCDLFDPLPCHGDQTLQDDAARALAEKIYDYLGIVSHQAENDKKSKKRKSKEANRAAKRGAKTATGLQSNMFAMLMDEDG